MNVFQALRAIYRRNPVSGVFHALLLIFIVVFWTAVIINASAIAEEIAASPAAQQLRQTFGVQPEQTPEPVQPTSLEDYQAALQPWKNLISGLSRIPAQFERCLIVQLELPDPADCWHVLQLDSVIISSHEIDYSAWYWVLMADGHIPQASHESYQVEFPEEMAVQVLEEYVTTVRQTMKMENIRFILASTPGAQELLVTFPADGSTLNLIFWGCPAGQTTDLEDDMPVRSILQNCILLGGRIQMDESQILVDPLGVLSLAPTYR